MVEKNAENNSFFSKISRKCQIALICAGLLLIIGCCATAVGLYAHFTKTEGVYEPLAHSDLYVDASLSDKSGIVGHIKKLIADASDSMRTNTKKEVFLNVENVNVVNGSEDETKTVAYVLEAMLSSIRGFYSEHYGAFGDGFSDSSLPQVSLNEIDISRAYAEVGKTEKNGEQTETDKLFFGITSVGGQYPGFVSEGIGKTFSTDEAEEIIKRIKSAFDNTANITVCDVKSDGFSVEGCENRADGRLDSISFVRSYTVSVTLEFIGKYATFGTKTIAFDYKSTQKYSFTWAGVEIAEEVISVAPGQNLMLTVNAVVDDKATNADYSVTFISSDEATATVDGDGIVKGVSLSAEPVEIKVEFVYFGNTYTDTCKVYVVNEVEKIKVSPEKLLLENGSSADLAYSLKPSDATVKTVTWHTENGEIAVVDENGTVTAKGTGETRVFAVSDDGHFRASCIVTVTEGVASNG